MNFLLNDDVTINSILNGSYTGVADGHGIYMRYPLTGIMSLLYRILPFIPWFTILLLGCYGFAIWAVLRVTGKKISRPMNWKNTGLISFSAAMLLLLLVPQMLELHYTVATAALCAGAIFLTVFGEMHWVPGIAFALAYCVRQDVFFLAAPFLFVALLWSMTKGRWKNALKMAGIAAGFGIVFMGINALFYSSNEWKEFQEFNRARTDLYDYSWYKQYQDIPDIYEEYGISYEQYLVVDNYALGLDSSLDAAFLQQMHEATQVGDWQDTMLHTVKRMMVLYRDWILKDGKEPFSYVAIFLYLILFMTLMRRKKSLQALLVLALGAGRSMIWMFLFWRGRFPERVMMSLFVIELILLLALLLDVFGEEKQQKLSYQLSFHGAGFVLAVIGIFLLVNSVGKLSDQAALQKDYAVLEDYFEKHKENTYLLDVRTMGVYTKGILDIDTAQPNTMLAGGWVTGSPLMKERYKALGVQDGGEALARKDNVYYVISDEREYDWLEEYLASRYPECRITLADTVKAQKRTYRILSAR